TRTLDGGLSTSEAWSGPVAGEVDLTLDGRGRVVATNTGGVSVTSAFDSAGRLSKAGDVALSYDSATGVLNQESLQMLTTTITFDAFGLLTGQDTGRDGGTPIFMQRLSRSEEHTSELQSLRHLV